MSERNPDSRQRRIMILMPWETVCERCWGSGYRPSTLTSWYEYCPVCLGSGRIDTRQWSHFL